jgi:hypothetical protein
MTVEIIQSHSIQIGEVTVNFTIGRIAKTDSRAKASEDNGTTAKDRDEVGTGVTGGESAATDFQSDGGEIAKVKGKARPADAVGVEPPLSESLPTRKKPLRPHCRHRDNCGGYGRNHCGACLKAAAESEAA